MRERVRTGDLLEGRLMFGGQTIDMDETARRMENIVVGSPGYDEESMSLDTTMNTTLNTTSVDTARGPLTDRNILYDSGVSAAGRSRTAAQSARVPPSQPVIQPRPAPAIRYPGEARANLVKRISENAKDQGLQRLIGLQVPLARGLRVKPVDAGVWVPLPVSLVTHSLICCWSRRFVFGKSMC